MSSDRPAAERPRVQPIVLCGGASRRFGRDKLVEPLADGLLIDRPIAALREVFGSIVAVVGECSEAVAERADMRLRDPYPGAGPIGGVLAALESTSSDVFVLAGDMPHVTAASVRQILDAARSAQRALAVVAETDRIHPCFGVYRVGAAAPLRSALRDERRALHRAIAASERVCVPVPAAEATNVNAQRDLSGQE